MKTFLDAASLSEEARARVHPIIEHGSPEIMFRTFVEERGADLTVIGAFGRGLMFAVLIGGNAQRIVDATPSDVLVVRAPRLGHD
jgi:nucleotide-binding universal stress UspA family protein